MRTGIAGQHEGEQGENQRVGPVAQPFVDFGEEQVGSPLVEVVIGRVRLQQRVQAAVARLQDDRLGRRCELGQVEGVGVEADEGNAAVGVLAGNLAVCQHQDVAFRPVDDLAALGVVDEVGVFLTRIRDENAAERAVRQPFGHLQEQIVVDLAEGTLLHDRGNQVGAGIRQQLPALLVGIGFDEVRNHEGQQRHCGAEGQQRAQHGHARRARGVDHHQLRILVQRVEAVGRSQRECERRDLGHHGRDGEQAEIDEAADRLAVVGDEVDLGDHLRRPHDSHHAEQRGQEQRQDLPADISLD